MAKAKRGIDLVALSEYLWLGNGGPPRSWNSWRMTLHTPQNQDVTLGTLRHTRFGMRTTV